ELDLELRGAGDINGTLQSGDAISLRIANPTRDVELLNLTRDLAAATLEADPKLEAPSNAGLKEMKRLFSGKESIDFSMIS
ncbi:MAG: ATP-dependent DNA helicase RecG, partial [Rikenellaceae bacterium]